MLAFGGAGVELAAVEEDVVAVGEGSCRDTLAHLSSRIAGVEPHIGKIPSEAGFHLGFQVAVQLASVALHGGELTAHLRGQGDAAARVSSADGPGDLAFFDDRIGSRIGLQLVGIAGFGHLELGADKDLGRHAYGRFLAGGLLRVFLGLGSVI